MFAHTVLLLTRADVEAVLDLDRLVDDGQLTLYKSVGVAVQDAAAAALVLPSVAALAAASTCRVGR